MKFLVFSTLFLVAGLFSFAAFGKEILPETTDPKQVAEQLDYYLDNKGNVLQFSDPGMNDFSGKGVCCHKHQLYAQIQKNLRAGFFVKSIRVEEEDALKAESALFSVDWIHVNQSVFINFGHATAKEMPQEIQSVCQTNRWHYLHSKVIQHEAISKSSAPQMGPSHCIY